ncbi:MAG TPA: phosphotransferase, partial [Candidatus Omnitrophica bacterium]|nr:phosphotransferase [Candidatus Omnitrophota bacterium]
MHKELKEYKGVIHVHTRSSDGSAGWENVLLSAQQSGLDYVIISDHNTLVLKHKEGWYGDTLLLVGEEISPKRSHYLAIGIERAI